MSDVSIALVIFGLAYLVLLPSGFTRRLWLSAEPR